MDAWELDQREIEERTVALARREELAEARDRLADRREAAADERERLADQREIDHEMQIARDRGCDR